ncbi:UDP-galactose transporter homolog 1 [Saitozyma sp. JCM 24511]|nr:UDP-galactose transporter homolog 1 [Saitozyma sp. JCM 24511]
MGVVRLGVCVSGVYTAFLFWAIAQERLSKPFPSTSAPIHQSPAHPLPGDKFPSPLFLNYAQALASSLSALSYLLFSAWRSGALRRDGLWAVLGPTPKRSLLFLLVQVSVFQTMAGPIGFLALRHISYPTMVLGKSCKLIPVMLLNVLLYRRKFSSHKYIVVALVTLGISLFMLLGPGGKKGGSDSAWGLALLGINLFIDGLTNSTQDQIFALYPSYTGQQMMTHMSLLIQLILLPALLLPLPSHPLSLLHHLPSPLVVHLRPSLPAPPIVYSPPAALTSLSFLSTHPTALAPLAAYALLGGLGQLFIFETIQHFGSLTLVMVTVTRKLFTMLLSVVVFEHELTPGQWAGVGVVFAGIGVEAGIKRRDVMRRARRD